MSPKLRIVFFLSCVASGSFIEEESVFTATPMERLLESSAGHPLLTAPALYVYAEHEDAFVMPRLPPLRPTGHALQSRSDVRPVVSEYLEAGHSSHADIPG